MKIVSIYRGKVQIVRGSPIRIKSIQEFLSKRDDVELTTATYDKSSAFSQKHILLKKSIWSELPNLIKYVNTNSVDAVICHGMLTYPAVIALRLCTDAKIVLEKHGFYETEQRMFKNISFFGWLKLRIIFWFTYKFSHLITSCSETATKIMEQYKQNVCTIWGGVDLENFNPQKSPGKFLKEKHRIVIGYAGNARSYQGLPFLLQAFKKIAKQSNKFSLAILCSDPFDDLNQNNVEIIDRVPHSEVPHFLSECDILVIPRIESEVNRISFPSKLLEFMAMGKPVICSKTSDMHKVVTHLRNGLLYEPGDVNHFIQLILSLDNQDERLRLGNNAYETAREKYTWEHQTDMLVAQIANLFNR